MANTPFDIETTFLEDGYVHTNTATGKKYVLNKRFAAYPYDTRQYSVWLPLSDVVNRTFVSPSDPTDKPSSAPNPKNGDLWWDNHQLELRVWHQPVIGNVSTGETVSGTGTWISSTHPMADMVTLDGNDKNHTFGNVVMFGEFGGFVYSGKYIDFEVITPGYTGPDGPPKDSVNPDPEYKEVSAEDRRFSYTWSVEPPYNAPASYYQDESIDDAEKEQYRNIIVAQENLLGETSEDHYKVRVKAGEIYSDGTPPTTNPYVRSINVKCKLTVKQDHNDKFLTMKSDSGEVVLHNVEAISAPQKVVGSRQATGFIWITPKAKRMADIFADSTVSAPGIDVYVDSNYETDGVNSLAQMFDVIDYAEQVNIDPGDPNSELVDGWSFETKAETGSFKIVDSPDELNQIPHLVLEYELSAYSELTVNFIYGETNKNYEDHITEPGFDPKSDLTVFDGTSTFDLANKFGLRFYRNGYTTRDTAEMPQGQDLIDYYQNEIGTLGSPSVIEIEGIQYISRPLVIQPGSEDSNTPSTMYFIGYDSAAGEFLPSYHGELRMKGLMRNQDGEETP